MNFTSSCAVQSDKLQGVTNVATLVVTNPYKSSLAISKEWFWKIFYLEKYIK